MRSKLSFVVFGFNDWETWYRGNFCTRCAKLVRLLAERPEVEKILLVSTPKSILMRLWQGIRRKTNRRGALLKNGLWFSLRQVDAKVYSLDHFRLLPREEGSNILFWINGKIHDRFFDAYVRKTIDNLGMSGHVLWLSNPLMIKHLGKLNEKMSVFDAIDDWRLHPQKKGIRKTVINSYSQITQKVDLILTVSPALKERLSTGKENVHWLPNGVDIEFFKHPRKMPEELTKVQRPIILYVGALQERVDVDLLSKIAGNFPNASLVLVGPIITPLYFQPLKKFSNSHFLGRKSHDQIAAFIQHSDVCIMPHKQDRFTASMNPLKLYEYLAGGKPVVSTTINGLESFEGIVSFARNADEFISLIDKVVRLRPAHLTSDRARFIDKCTWNRRVESILELLSLHLNKGDTDSLDKVSVSQST